MQPDPKIIEKIQKLLSLANSDNEHEAKSATTRANELLLKYNLSLQQISDHQSEYEVQDVLETGLTLKPHQLQISQILLNFFFVKIIIHKTHVGYSSGQYAQNYGPRSQYKKVFQLVGTKENCSIASYVFSYLNAAYPKLWKEYYDRNSRVDKSHQNSYYAGLTIGIMEVLELTKFRIEDEMGLVVKEDPNLKKFVEDRASGSYGSNKKPDIDPETFAHGIRDGSKVRLRKPIESTSTDNGLYLEGKKK